MLYTLFVGRKGNSLLTPPYVLCSPLMHASVSFICAQSLVVLCRVGQELGPSAVLHPLHEALAALQQNITSNPTLLGTITSDLLATLADAAVFQELCSGDMGAVPGLTSSSRLDCLLHFLHNEAASLQPGLHHTHDSPRQNIEQQQHSSQPAQKHQGEDHERMNKENNQQSVAQKAGPPDSHQAQHLLMQNGAFGSGGSKSAEENDSLDTFVSVETSVEDDDSDSMPSAFEGDSPFRLHAMIVVAEQVTAQR